MKEKTPLLVKMIVKGLLGFLLLGLPIFAGAGSFRVPNAWLLILSLFIPMMTMGMVLLVKYPETLEKRLKAKESQKEQKGYIAVMGLLFLASFVLAGLDHRFGWSNMPLWGSLAALAVMLLGYGLFCAVILQNAYASRVVEIQKDQVLISGGLYALVRHPMYLACLLLFLSMPLVLGSYVALLPMLIFPVTLVLRIKNEEVVLLAGLEGYAQYTRRTRYRLIPYLW
ncbi:MAG: isoprenylcysteine carboxylmethyltransferase family protein [Candidatus Limiplasma sp.]|nr:isoprenylcysteine carboxylmethyltransferase family protein [Candidatus Limiplasma sp.]